MSTPSPMPAPHRGPLVLFAAEAVMLVDALGIAIDHYTAKAEAGRKLTATGLTISARRRAAAEALDLTAHARKLDALRLTLAA